MNINREYKASVFSLLFSDPDVLRELYGAIEGVTIDPSVPITINTLENVIFLDRINDISLNTAPELELSVRVYNINKGRNESIVRRCEKLNGYSAFIDKVREFEKQDMVLEEAVSAAVKWCVSNNVLKDFMLIHGSEVISMLVTEWNWDTALEVRERDGVEKGKEEDVRNMSEYGMPPDQIAKALKLPLDKVLQYQGRK
jgi:hypothetical protein